jgi:hypothetical protein
MAEWTRLGFEAVLWFDVDNDREQLWLRHTSDPKRRPPDWLALAIAEQRRVVCGYLRRIRSPFFDGDHELALSCAQADDERLRTTRPRDVRRGDRWLDWHEEKP